MVTNAELASKVAELEARLSELEEVEDAAAEFDSERFDDLLAAVMAALVRSRSQGAFRTASLLAEKYLPAGTSVQDYGEAFVASSTLYSAGKVD